MRSHTYKGVMVNRESRYHGTPPVKPGQRYQQVMVHLTPAQVKALDISAQEKDRSRSSIVRDLINDTLADLVKQARKELTEEKDDPDGDK